METELIIPRIRDAIRLCDTSSMPKFVGFLTASEAAIAAEFGSKIGCNAELFGGYDGKLPTAEGIAKIAGTINYEVSCAVSRRVPRVYIENGEIVNVINRLTNK